MKNIVLFCLLALTSTNLFSQSDKDAILQTFSEYSTHVVDKNNAKLVEYLHPGMFEIAPKKMLIEMMDKAFEDPSIAMSFGAMRIDSLSDIMIDEANKYCLIYHNFDLKMDMLPSNDSEEAMNETRKGAVYAYEFMQQAYGEENVEFDKENASFKILITSQTFAINDDKTDGWKFIEAKKEAHIILENILPANVFSIVQE